MSSAGFAITLCIVVVSSACWWLRDTMVLAVAMTLLRMLCCKGRRARGQLTGLVFPICVEDLTSPSGAALLTRMLQHGQHLPHDVVVTSVRNLQKNVRDGVKGDKALLEVTYSATVDLPTHFFLKCNLQRLGAMRLLVATSDVCMCEALFYHYLAPETKDCLRTPKCYFVDFNSTTGEFCLLTEVLDFGGKLLPLKHRIRDAATMEEQLLFIETGARLHARSWSWIDSCNAVLKQIPRFHDTHRQMWLLCMASGCMGLKYTVRKTVKGKRLNPEWMTWSCPTDLVGKEWQLIWDMADILTSLSLEKDMAAFGHNDLTTDNAFYWQEDGGKRLSVGLFDWQQSCMNNIGQEWAWNWHFLEPEFLDKNEEAMITALLSAYSKLGRSISRKKFLRAYTLGTIQMFVFGGGGLQLLMKDLEAKGIFQTLVPNDPRSGPDGPGSEDQLREILTGAEMTRRTFTNCCNIMRRHNFYSAWQDWKRTRALTDI